MSLYNSRKYTFWLKEVVYRMLKLKQVQEKSREHESENEWLGVITLKIQNGGQKTFWPKGKQQISKYYENIKYSCKVEVEV